MTFRLISFDLCPFVQRSVITLQEKGEAYDIEYIDLENKPDWFKAISPFGKVPVLEVSGAVAAKEITGTEVVVESAVINEYLDEVTGTPLHPADPLRRAHNRGWIEYGSALLVENYRLMLAADEEQARTLAKKCNSMLATLEKAFVGPFFNGDEFSLVDAALAPALQRIDWCEQLEPSLQLWAGRSVAKSWWQQLSTRPSVVASLLPGMQDNFTSYLQGRGSPTRNVEPSWLGTRTL